MYISLYLFVLFTLCYYIIMLLSQKQQTEKRAHAVQHVARGGQMCLVFG